MVSEKLKNQLTRFLFYLYFLVFPLGVLPAQLLSLKIHLADTLVLLISLIFVVARNHPIPKKYLLPLLVIDITIFFSPLGSGLLYLVRFCGYFVLIFAVKSYTKEKLFSHKLFTKALLYISTSIATIGLVQYFLVPDLRTLKLFGWDDHYHRLVSTFLDPAFTGIILSLGIILSIFLYYRHKNLNLLWLIAFLGMALGLTYSRASFLSLGAGLCVYFGIKYWRKSVTSMILIAALISSLPRGAGGEGVNLVRTSSIIAKASNIEQSLKIISTSPLFGVGMNNICSIRAKLFSYPTSSHACSGLDNSVLFILATSGVVGLFSFTYIIWQFYLDSRRSKYYKLFVSSAAAVLTHSMFTNTLFYPWVMGWMAIVLGLALSTSQSEP